ncbi:unnamed protein product, partial [Cuscuta epithymum]
MADWRPISLCNVLFRIFSKVLANRLKKFLGYMISHNQSAFVPGRSIVDNIMIAFEAHHYLKRKRQGIDGYIALKLDMSKAYDRIEWNFLEAVLARLGFDGRWVSMIMQSVKTVTYSIPFDGSELGPVIPHRGLRQGDPLSPYLFILVAEGLSARLRQEEAAGRLHGVCVARGAPRISHLLFADDCFLFFKASHDECSIVKTVLEDYEVASGQVINYNKSTISFSANISSDRREGYREMFSVQPMETGAKYLGLPSLVGRSKREVLAFIKERIVKRISCWNHKFLSRAGREVLIKTVLQAMPSYAMNVFLFPKDMCTEIERIMNGFWWKGHSSTGIRWTDWERLCVPKKYGGMGFRRLHDFNLVMLGKQVWRLLTAPDSLLSKVFKARYFPRSSFIEAKIGGSPSFIWRSIMEAKPAIINNFRWRIGNGKSVNIWRDPWLPDRSYPKPVSQVIQGLEETKVEGLISNGNREWDRDLVFELFNPRDMSLILGLPLSQRDVPDRIFWPLEDKGNFSVKSCYRALVGEVNSSGHKVNWTSMWKFDIPPKVKSFFWQTCAGHLPTADKLLKRRVACQSICPVCSQEEETLLHIFGSCHKALQVWSFSRWHIPVSAGTSFNEWVEHVFRTRDVEQCSLFVMLLWSIWKARNVKVWEQKEVTVEGIVSEAKAFWEGWRRAQEGVFRTSQQHGGVMSWKRPEEGRLKLNTDASVLPGNISGLGWVVRDSGGFFVAGGVNTCHGCSPAVAEALSIREALSWLKQQGWDNIDVESDSIQIISRIKSGSDDSLPGLIVEDIRDISSGFTSISFSHVKRSANRVAHDLARAAVSMSDRYIWIYTNPPCITY